MNGNRSAWLAMLRGGEGGTGPNAYRKMYGGATFDDFAQHPFTNRLPIPFVDLNGETHYTTASGAYGATLPTWKDFLAARGPHDFSPASQDEFALWLTEKCAALDDVDAGRLEDAIRKCGGRWASLPSSTAPQGKRTLDSCRADYLLCGGNLYADVPVQPQPAEAATDVDSRSLGERLNDLFTNIFSRKPSS